MSLISKEGLIKSLERSFNLGMINTYQEVIDAVYDAPVIDPVNHGKWLHEVADSKPYYDICEHCGSVYPHAPENNYCMKCGYKMD